MNAKPLVVLLALLTAGCSGASSALPSHSDNSAPSLAARHPSSVDLPSLSHIVVIIQENRSVDNLFGGPTPFCPSYQQCVQTVATDPVTNTPLAPVSLGASNYDPSHTHKQFVTQFDYGAMDGFPQSTTSCGRGPCGGPYTVFSYVPSNETTGYRNLAINDGAVSDMTFEPNQGPSFPSHHYSIAGQSGGYDSDELAFAENPLPGSTSCFSQRNATVSEMEMYTSFPGVETKGFPCKDYQTIFDLLSSHGYSWRYYISGNDPLWSPTQAIQHLSRSRDVVSPETQILNDIRNQQLANVSFVTPSKQNSDHPANTQGFNPANGPNWVASIVNAVGNSRYWYSTAIVVYWDDWGGWFDHVTPPSAPFSNDPYEYGFRVPLFVVSPFARVGYVDHTPRTFVSSLRLIESAFGLQSLGTLDALEPDSLDPMFDFAHAHAFVPVSTSKLTQVRPPKGR